MIQTEDKVDLLVKTCEEMKAEDVVTLKIDPSRAFTNYFIIASASNKNLTKAIAREVQNVMAEKGEFPIGIEGLQEGEWVLIDYGDAILHVFTDEYREFYDLERLWS